MGRPAAGLAAGRPAVVRSGVAIKPVIDAAARLQRAKERLYVVCQLGGWGVFLVVQLAVSRIFADSKTAASRDWLTETSINVMIILMGLVLTHYARMYMNRWGWKQLSWRALIPRVIAMAAVLSFFWSAAGYGYSYGVIGLPWTSKVSIVIIFLFSCLNGTGLMVGWLALYFFYHVLERLQRMQVEQLRLAASVKEAELRALKSQVNPHFLFNSLNSLRALIDEDAPRAREAVTRLANMLRYSLQSGNLETVSLEEELRTVEDYLALEQIRHEGRLSVRWAVGEEARAQSIPPMLLQTLVENAVKYGISTRREGGEVTISARIEAGVLHVSVTNPGDLAPAGNEASAKAGSSTGVGLRNASERLKLLYGDQATLRLLAEPAGCVTAGVAIPLKSTAP